MSESDEVLEILRAKPKRSAVPDAESWVSAAGVRRVCESWFGILAEHGSEREWRFTPVWAQTKFGLEYVGERGFAIATPKGVYMAPSYRLFQWDDLIAFPDDWDIAWEEREAKVAYRRESEAQWAAEWAARHPGNERG